MRVAAVVAVALASAAGGAAATGWIITTRQPTPPAGIMATNTGYLGPAGVPVGAPPGQIPFVGLGIADPYAKSPQAVAEGKRLFSAMNCAGCHGYTAKGAMGPDLTNDYWRYGGAPVQIYKSIYEGRPKGMPAWGQALPPTAIWAMTAYIGSLGGASHAPNTSGGAPGTNAGSTANAPQPSRSGAGLEGQ